MASEHFESFEADSQHPTVLNRSLRNLVIADSPSGLDSGLQETQVNTQARTSTTTPPHNSSGHDKKFSKRRPNQAQRRQMSSQMSFSIDPRDQYPSHEVNLGNGPLGQVHRPRSDHQAADHPTVPTPARHHGFYEILPCNFSAQGSSTSRVSWSANRGPPGRQAHSAFHQDPYSASHFRFGPRTPRAQLRTYFRPEDVASQEELLERLCHQVVPQ